MHLWGDFGSVYRHFPYCPGRRSVFLKVVRDPTLDIALFLLYFGPLGVAGSLHHVSSCSRIRARLSWWRQNSLGIPFRLVSGSVRFYAFTVYGDRALLFLKPNISSSSRYLCKFMSSLAFTCRSLIDLVG